MRFTTCPVPECGAALHASVLSLVDVVGIDEHAQMVGGRPSSIKPSTYVYCGNGHEQEQIQVALDVLLADVTA